MPPARFCVVAGVFGLGCALVPLVQLQPAVSKEKPTPKLVAVADTKLLMEGLAGANMRGLGNLLRDRPREAEAWGFVRGQALLIAETGNLLLIRPPRTPASQDAWLDHATEMREAAATLARAAAAKDYQKCRSALAGVANTCNRCHQTFQVGVRVDPFADE